MKIKILNLYAGLGGNRKLWNGDIEVTAIELDPSVAAAYKKFFPKDKVIITDAHQFLLDHYKEFNFIWSSPPCQSHASFRFNIGVRFRGTKPIYPDMRLYQEIIFLKYHFKGKWVVENVKPYYKPLLPAQLLQRHLFWSNFKIEDRDFKQEKLRAVQIPQLQEIHGFNLDNFTIKNKRQILRNCVNADLGNHIFKCAMKNERN